MRVSLNWLRDYVDVDIPLEDFCNKMIMTGFEVEEIDDLSASMDKVVVGQINSIEKHPNADKLLICMVNIGDNVIQIVTGADNISTNDLIPVAIHGAHLPDGTKIKKGKLRGEQSEGMLCSGEELNLKEGDFPNAEVDGILILDDSNHPGTDMREVLGLNDIVIDFAITANRPDCQSIIGFAREVAAALDAKVILPTVKYETVGDDINNYIKVSVKDYDLCPRYYGRIIKNVKNGPSPDWMQKRLRASGMRPISKLVDITNYVMLETGQPMHAFDLRDIKGNEIIVRRAEQDEIMTTLDGKKHTLSNEMLTISDAKAPSCLAGVMGSLDSEIKSDTKDVFLESAKFRRDNIRRTSRSLGIRTESSARFEKGMDFMNTEYAMERALSLIYELDAADIVDGFIDKYSPELGMPKSKVLNVSVKSINQLLGLQIDANDMVKILNSLEIKTSLQEDTLTCTIPSWRGDIEGSADITEEVIRLYGYEHITSDNMRGTVTRGKKTKQRIYDDLVKERLVAQGLFEATTYSFIPKKAPDQLMLDKDDIRRKTIPVLNPISEDLSQMRTQLISSMLTVLSTNYSRKIDSVRLFEIGHEYFADKLPLTKQPEERPALCIGLMGKGEDFYTLKGVVEEIFAILGKPFDFKRSNEPYFHPGRQACIIVDDIVMATFGEIHPDVAKKYGLDRAYIADVQLDLLHKLDIQPIVSKPLPRYPAIERDIALVCDENLPAGEIKDTIYNAGGRYLESVELFDIYHGSQVEQGKKSIAWRMVFRKKESTLTDKEVDKSVKNIIEYLEKLGCTLRKL